LFIRDELDNRAGRRLERFVVDKMTGRFKNDQGREKAPVAPYDDGYRPTMSLGVAGSGEQGDPRRGTVLSALPLHPSPAASSASTCYLVNAQNLNYTTPWTAEEWNDQPNGPNAEGFVRPDRYCLLIASPAGKVYYLEKKTDRAVVPIDNEHFVFREVELGAEAEIWGELRNGCVAGSVVYEAKPAKTRREKVVPLVNIDSLTPRDPDEIASTGRGETR
jgi:hypothetical protein